MTPERQFEILSQGTEEILPEGDLLRRLRRSVETGRPLRVKQGFDPTAPDIHLGHSVGLRKLRQFQELGHQIVLIVGDYTGMVGDPSGRNKTRPQLTQAQVEDNARTYLEQFYRVLERDPAPPLLPVETHRNGEWFSKMSFMDIMKLGSQYTIARMLEREDFSKRYREQQPISIHELFYPLMQGWDSVEIRADVELGGTEQKFNLIVGRQLQESHGQEPQLLLTLPLLPGLDGKQRMSKSLGNYVGVTDAPAEMFGKIMSLPDDAMPLYWRLVTGATPEEVRAIEAELAGGVNPMQVKKRLGVRIVTLYHGAAAAAQAQEGFETQFSRGGVPEDLPLVGRAELAAVLAAADPAATAPTALDLIMACGFAPSRSAARRLFQQGAISFDGEKLADFAQPLDAAREIVVRAGRKMARYRPG